MIEWNEFAAFGDIAELERVCGILEDDAGAVAHGASMSNWTSQQSYLRQQLKKQDCESCKLLESEKPGLYARTWISHLFADIYLQLDGMDELSSIPAESTSGLVLNLHKVLIAAHDIFDPAHRAKLIAGALVEGMKNGAAEAKKQQSEKARDAVKARSDQKIKSVFIEWAREAIAEGASANTVEDLQGLKNFQSEWSRMSEGTLKKWAKEAGFRFKTGRPKGKSGGEPA